MKKILVLVVPLLIGVLLLSLLFSLEQRGSTASEPEILPLFPVKSPDRLSFVGHANSTDGAEPALRTPSGAIWNREPLAVAAGFTSAFRFRINDQAALEKQAGGLSFAIQNAGLTAIAETDCRLGRSVLPNSVVIELNPFERRPACDGADLQARGLGINLNHSLPGEPAAPNENYSLGRLGPDSVPSLNDGRSHLILVEYSPGLLNVYLDDLNAPLLKARVDLALELRLTEGRAWLGFTSDEAASQNLEILEWWYWRMSDAAGLDRRMIISGATVEEPARENIFGPIPTPSPAMPAGYCPGLANGPENGTYQVLNPGSSATIYSSAHFAARWNASNNVPLTEAQAQEGLNTLEQLWTKYIAELGFPRPYDTDAVKYKVDVNVSDQGWASGGGTGAGHPAMWLHYNAFRDPGALAHEFTHTLQFSSRGMRDSVYTGWSWESHAEWMRHQFFRDQVNCAELLVNYPHLYYGSTRDRYCNWQFWEFIKDKYCYRIVTDIWALSKKPGEPGYRDEDPFTVLARNVGWSQSQFNDEFGDWARHNATWDYPNGAVYRQRFGSYSDRGGLRRTRVTMLQELDLAQRQFVVPEYWAPQRWGYNLVRLVPDRPRQNGTVTVTFRGVVQTAPASTDFGSFARQPATIPAPDSDWRWGLVARSITGATRYSPLQRGADGQVSFQVNATDMELWLVVVATPSTMHKILWDQMYYTIYRYPWMVQLEGAWPEGYPAPAPPSGSGARHPNGGGWVASTARVAATAFVGPRAQVLGNAMVSGNARIEGSAIVGGNAQVRDNAIVEDFAQVLNGQVYENARVSALTVVNSGAARIHGSARIAAIMNAIGAFDVSGTAQLLGDVELLTPVSRGVFYGFIDAAVAADPAYGLNRTAPSPEVTIPGPFIWR